MKTFQQQQAQFVEYIRNPNDKSSFENIEPRRLLIYQELLFNNMLGFLTNGFPLLVSIYGEQKWKALAKTFFKRHQCKSPYFVEISKEFVEYLSNEYTNGEDDPVFLQELAHYEWLELAISVKKSQQQARAWNGKEKISNICFSDVAEISGYNFPVHQISTSFQPTQKSESIFIIVYRKMDFEIGFTVVNNVTAHLITLLLQKSGHTLESVTDQMLKALAHLPSKQVISGTKQTIEQLLKQQVLLIPND